MFWVSTALILVAIVPYAVQWLDGEQFDRWRNIYADIPVSIAALVAALVGLRRVGSAAERHFWRLVALAYAAIVVVEILNAFLPDAAFTSLGELLLYSGFLCYYGALMLAAAASQGGAWDQGVWTLHRLRSVGLGVLGVGFLIYYQAVPYSPAAGTEEPWNPGLFLFATLDIVAGLMFLRAWQRHESPRWRGILLGFAAVSGLYLIVDVWEAVLYLEPFLDVELAPLWDLAWFAPALLSIGVARRHLAEPAEESSEPKVRSRPRPDRGLLLVGLFAIPLLHVFLYYLGFLDPAFRQTREGVVVLFVLVMGAITLAYFRILERERASSERELALSEERYRSFVRARSDGIYRAEVAPGISTSADIDVQIEQLAARACVAEAKDVSHLPDGVPTVPVGGSLVELFPPASLWQEGLRRWIESDYRIELEVVHEEGDGQRWYYRYGLTGIIENGALYRVWLTRSDVTPKRRSDEEAERLLRELEQSRKLESLGTLAGGLAHDFNNLLAPIMGYTELAREAIDRNEPGAGEKLEHVLSASKRAADLVEQILLVSRDRPRRRVPVRLQETISAAIRLIRTGLPHSIAIDTSVDADCPPILGDASRLHQVVLNLCTNAAQVIGSAPGHIELRLRHEAGESAAGRPLGWVVLEVEDDGPGVSEATRQRVFEPFFTTTRQEDGPGLGLSVVHGIVTSHEGRVDFDSEPGRGTKVTMHFPATARARLQDGSPRSRFRSSLQILVVDDQEAVSGVTRSILEAYGHTVTAVTDPYQALKELRARPTLYDVVVTDYSMPGLTGLDLVDAVKEVAPHAGVVLSSGYNLADRQLSRGVVHLAKPFTTAQLADTVWRAKSLAKADGDG